MVLLGIMTILFYLIPAVKVEPFGQAPFAINMNLFTATFGGTISLNFPGGNYGLLPCGGLVVAFCLGIVGILLTFAKCKIKFATLFAFPFYLTAGILVACTGGLVASVNHFVVESTLSYTMIGGAITVATFFCILAFFALVDFITTIAKPKQQQPAY